MFDLMQYRLWAKVQQPLEESTQHLAVATSTDLHTRKAVIFEVQAPSGKPPTSSSVACLYHLQSQALKVLCAPSLSNLCCLRALAMFDL